jgi:hypothetical protein
MTYSNSSSFTTMSSIRTFSHTPSVSSGPDPFLDFDGAYSIYDNELKLGCASSEDTEDGRSEHADREDGREVGKMELGRKMGQRERVRRWLRKVLRCL